MIPGWVTMFVNSSKVGGWVRAGVASGLVTLIANNPWLAQYLSPTTQQAIAVAASGIAVGIWSHISKTTSVESKPVKGEGR